MKIYLASKSPRRNELLKQMEVPFELLSVDAPEIVKPNERPEEYSTRVTQEKLHAARDKIINENLHYLPVLCADTEVVLNGKILGKPRDEDDAFNMLRQYSGQSHQVITSVGLIYKDYETIRMNTTWVTFAKMSDEVIRHYLASDNYKDKSGAYGIQSYIGQFISRIDGCFYSVMGLPLNTVREMLNDCFAQINDELR
ncbi:MAG: Maf family protein [Legionellaceae bacterium]|nr:Maf family protein [Legionellaceae bacterium]